MATDLDALPEALTDWFADYGRSLRRRGRSAATADVYRRAYLRFWRWALANGVDPDPAAVTTGDVNRWVDALRDEVSPTTTALYWRNLKPFFTWWSAEMDETSPFDRADTPGTPETTVPVVHLDDLRRLVDTCGRDPETGKKSKSFNELRDTALILVLADCGLRLGELVSLTVGAWDRRLDVLHVDGKTGPRGAPHGPATGEALARYLRVRATHSYAHLDALWLARRGALGPSGVAQVMARRCQQAGLPRWHPHLLRHWWSHEVRSAGGSEGDLMILAGWRSPAMAHRYGRSAAGERARKAAQRIGLGDRLV